VPRKLHLVALVASTFALTAFAPASGEAPDAWVLLQGVRASLADAGPTGATFVQTYLPAGFTSGETEKGTLALNLPDCMRWDYTDPFPKSFLICGGNVNAWNAEDKTGRRYRVDRKNEPGLDLLLLGVPELKERYKAEVAPLAGADAGLFEVALTPKEKLGVIADATLTVDPKQKRIVRITYHDREGNLTRFEIAGYAPLARQGRFSPPAGIRWEDQ